MVVILKKSTLRLAALLLVLVLALLGVANTVFTRTLNRHPEEIKSLLNENLGLTVEFKRMELSLFSGLKFTDLLLYQDNKLIARVKRLKLGFSLLALLRGELAVNKIVLQDILASADLTRYQDRLILKLKEIASKKVDKPVGVVKFSLAYPKIIVKDLRIQLGSQEDNHGFVAVDFQVKFRRENLICSSAIDFSNSNFEHSRYLKIFHR